MERFRFVLFRPMQLIPVLFGVSLVTFILVRAIPGDPVRTCSAPGRTAEVDRRGPRQIRPRSSRSCCNICYFLKNLLRRRVRPLDHLQAPVLDLVVPAHRADAVPARLCGRCWRWSSPSVSPSLAAPNRGRLADQTGAGLFDRRSRPAGLLARHRADHAVQHPPRLVSRSRAMARIPRPSAPSVPAGLHHRARLVADPDPQPSRQPDRGDARSDYVSAARAARPAAARDLPPPRASAIR